MVDWRIQLIATIVISAIVSAVVGALGYFLKKTFKEIKSDYTEIKESIKDIGKKCDEIDKKYDKEIKRLEGEFHQFEKDVPLMFVTKDEFVRVLNNVEKKLDMICFNTKKGG